MSAYKHRVTIIVPEHLMNQANHLAVVMGEDLGDMGTFTEADWSDEDGRGYSVCSTLVKPEVVNILTAEILDAAISLKYADLVEVESAMSKLKTYTIGHERTYEHIIIAIDLQPLQVLKELEIYSV